MSQNNLAANGDKPLCGKLDIFSNAEHCCPRSGCVGLRSLLLSADGSKECDMSGVPQRQRLPLNITQCPDRKCCPIVWFLLEPADAGCSVVFQPDRSRLPEMI